MKEEHQKGWRDGGTRAALLCLVLSLLLHLLLAVAFWQLPRAPHRAETPRPPQKERLVRVVRSHSPEDKPATKELPFAKTDVETPQQRPDTPDYIGNRDTRAASDPNAARLRNERHAPAMEGEIQEEMNTLEQERQDGPLAFEGREAAPAPSPPAPEAAEEGEEAHPPVPEPQAGDPQGADTPAPQGQESAPEPASPLPPEEQGSDQAQQQAAETAASAHAAPGSQPLTLGDPFAQGNAPLPQPARSPRRPAAYYDPSLPSSAQPGFRTQERRTRSSGTFIIGSRPALHVAATPRGQYEAEIYRRIARYWYAACDEHRGDIIPGSLTISLRLNRNGRLHSMDLIRRRGASMLQQSFTLAAIRQATLPPMPPAVQQEIVGDLLELLFTFNFD